MICGKEKEMSLAVDVKLLERKKAATTEFVERYFTVLCVCEVRSLTVCSNCMCWCVYV